MDKRLDLPQVEDPMTAPRYSEIATFMRAPFTRDPTGAHTLFLFYRVF